MEPQIYVLAGNLGVTGLLSSFLQDWGYSAFPLTSLKDLPEQSLDHPKVLLLFRGSNLQIMFKLRELRGRRDIFVLSLENDSFIASRPAQWENRGIQYCIHIPKVSMNAEKQFSLQAELEKALRWVEEEKHRREEQRLDQITLAGTIFMPAIPDPHRRKRRQKRRQKRRN